MPPRSNVRTAAPLVAAVTSCLALSACGEIEIEGFIADPSVITVDVSADRASIRPGEPVTVTVALGNPTDERVVLQLSSGCTFLIELRDPHHQRITPESACAMQTARVEFEPGEVKARQFVWAGEVERCFQERSGELETCRAEPVLPGRYEFTGYLGQRKLIVGEPVEVEVLPSELLQGFSAEEFRGSQDDVPDPEALAGVGTIGISGAFATGCGAGPSQLVAQAHVDGSKVTLRVGYWLPPDGSCLGIMRMLTYEAVVGLLEPGLYRVVVVHRAYPDDVVLDQQLEVR